MTDPIADMLTRIRNAVHARHTRVDVPASRFKAEIARILEQEGYIQGFKVLDPDEAPQANIRLFLKYGPRGENVISGLERVSRPGRRVYLGREDVPRVMGDQDRLDVREVLVEGRSTDAGPGGDLGHRHPAQPALGDHGHGGVEDRVTHGRAVGLDGGVPQFRHAPSIRNSATLTVDIVSR